jgi:hypothetical protein
MVQALAYDRSGSTLHHFRRHATRAFISENEDTGKTCSEAAKMEEANPVILKSGSCWPSELL